MKKILLTGANGQLGWELERTVPDDIELLALTHADLDICNYEQVTELMRKYNPDWIINAAAFTAVDKAESQQDEAFLINAEAPENLAKACRDMNIKMLQISTDFVFDGLQGKPYSVKDDTNPINVYGSSKQKGDEAVQKVLGQDAIIVRSSWIYSVHGHNFVKTMLRLMLEKDSLDVVVDQVGTPTWAFGLAHAIWELITNKLMGVFHYSDSGVASWYDFAIAIQSYAFEIGLIDRKILIRPISQSHYRLPAKRPHYSVLDKQRTIDQFGVASEHWQVSLRKMLVELQFAQLRMN